MNTTLTIARKEFSENLRSMRFTILFGLFLVMLLLAAYQGAQEYQNELSRFEEMKKGVQGDDYEISYGDMPKPSILEAFRGLVYSGGVTIIGAIIGIVIGFDAISGEREKGTLKFLLTQPLYRDTLINGKLLGFTLLIFTVVLISSVMTLGVVGGITGIFPVGDEILRLLVFNVMLFLYIMTFAVIGMFFSIFLKQSVDAVLAAIAVFIVVNLLIGSIAGAAANFIAPLPKDMFMGMGSQKDWEKAYKANWNVQQKINYLSPSENFREINQVILNPSFEKRESGERYFGGFGKEVTHSVTESLGMVWANVVAILVGLVVFFIASYIGFLRQDVG